jgi:hypothetical protein
MAGHANILVVASLTATSQDLLAALRERAARGPIAVYLLMPAQSPGFSGREALQPQLDAALASWREAGLDADGEVGDVDPITAVHEVWDQGRFDEAIVSTLPGSSSRWLEFDFPHRVARITGVSVTHVVAMDLRPEPAHGPPPPREHAALGPLSVLSWGGRAQQR